MRIYDTHAHLDHCPDADQALAEAYEKGVDAVVAVGVDAAANRKNLSLKKKIKHPTIYVALGLHPGNLDTEDMESSLEFIRDHLSEAVAIGEIGLDYWYKDVRKNDEKKEQQRRIFRRQCLLAREFNCPIIVHSRGAWRDCLDILKETDIQKAEFHWYSGPLDILDGILLRGYYVSATPSLAYSLQHQQAVRHAPIEQTLIETDTPVFYRDGQDGFESRPKDVFRTLQLYCALKKLSPHDAVAVLNGNAEKFFGIQEKERVAS